MTEIQNKALLFPKLKKDQLKYLNKFGQEIDFKDGEILFKEGEKADYLFVVLEGKIKITKQIAEEETVLTVHEPGQFTGEIALLTGGKNIATGTAQGNCRVRKISAEDIKQFSNDCPELSDVFLKAIASRRPEAEALTNQREKLAALGTMAAGLAHELNNPATAALRFASQLNDAMAHMQSVQFELMSSSLTKEQTKHLQELIETVKNIKQDKIDSLEQSDREEELIDWMNERGFEESNILAAHLASWGLDVKWLNSNIKNSLSDIDCDVMQKTLQYLNANCLISQLQKEIVTSLTRLTDLVGAMKRYSFMDQSPSQQVDIAQGIRDTLLIMSHKKPDGVKVITNFQDKLPLIKAYGSELNQVWTNIIDNAFDAISNGGELEIKAFEDCSDIVVEFTDDGPGIPKEVMRKVFDPFFTTKDVGKGSGLGLSISYKIIRERHHGDLTIKSKRGKTEVKICLPISMNK